MRISIYTDGSAIGNQNVDKDTPAGWGFVVVENGDDTHSAGKAIIEKRGKVVTDESHPLYIGAEVGSNNTGELSAIYEALEEIIEKEYESATIYSDSQYALGIIFGPWTASKNKMLVRNCKAKLLEAEIAGYTINQEHIKAHAGFKWNERADALAYSAASREPLSP